MALGYAFKRGQWHSCGNSFREAVPLRDGVGEDSLLQILSSVEGHTNDQRSRVGLAVAFLLVPCSWHVLGVYLQQTVPELVEHSEYGLLPS